MPWNPQLWLRRRQDRYLLVAGILDRVSTGAAQARFSSAPADVEQHDIG
jgi:hypothetical protein